MEKQGWRVTEKGVDPRKGTKHSVRLQGVSKSVEIREPLPVTMVTTWSAAKAAL